jgi:hypothetical protein
LRPGALLVRALLMISSPDCDDERGPPTGGRLRFGPLDLVCERARFRETELDWLAELVVVLGLAFARLQPARRTV